MPLIVESLDALEILDSRGHPTLQATCRLSGGFEATAQVPSGASTGRAEAVELRDGDPARHAGRGCLKAVRSVTDEIAGRIVGAEWKDQRALDEALVALDGTANKSRLGANAILGVSLAFARADARRRGLPLYQHFAQMAGNDRPALPRLTVNLFSGGRHAGGQVAIQDVLLVPVEASSIRSGLDQVCAVYRAAAEITRSRYGARALVADEGGLAPPFPNSNAMLEDAVRAIESAGFVPGRQIALAVDVAASHFFDAGRYRLDGKQLTSEQMIEQLMGWRTRFPIVSFEDGLAEEQWEAWPGLCKALTPGTIVLGDDLLCTHPARIQRAIDARAATALLLKVNQIGTLSEALDARDRARQAGWSVTVSARSGETEDDWLADLAVGWRGDCIKVGSVTRSERLSKYNRLLAIEAELELDRDRRRQPGRAS
ncbi:MAG: phosphopyruvate hydratase [Limisphaerales bacterium]